MTALPCNEVLGVFSDMLAGEVPSSAGDQVEAHLKTCASCRREIESFCRIDRELAEVGVEWRLPGLLEQIRCAVASRADAATDTEVPVVRKEGAVGRDARRRRWRPLMTVAVSLLFGLLAGASAHRMTMRSYWLVRTPETNEPGASASIKAGDGSAGLELAEIEVKPKLSPCRIKPGGELRISFRYDIWARPGAVCQIGIAFGNEYVKCVYSGIPGPDGVNGDLDDAAFRVPERPRNYSVRVVLTQTTSEQEAKEAFEIEGADTALSLGVVTIIE